MKLLYDDKLAPITSTLGFLEVSMKSLVSEYEDWLERIGKHPKRIHATGTLEEVLLRLLPLTIVHERELFVSTRSNWTAYFDNGWQGSAASERVGHLYRLLQCRGVRAVCVPHTMRGKDSEVKGRYGAVVLEVFSPNARNSLGYERVVCAANDGGPWVFETLGEPYHFEQTGNYKSLRKRDRFTPEMLKDYLLHLGIDAFNEDFYVATAEHPGLLFEVAQPETASFRRFTLEEARGNY